MAGTYPAAQFTGFDISAAQFPPPEALPSNVTLKQRDIYAPVPAEDQAAFDIVHVRLLTAAIRDGNPLPVLHNVLKMLSMSRLLYLPSCTPTYPPPV